MVTKERLEMDIISLRNSIAELSWKLDYLDLEDDVNISNAEEILNNFKRVCERSGIWNEKLDEELQNFNKFYLPDVLASIHK